MNSREHSGQAWTRFSPFLARERGSFGVWEVGDGGSGDDEEEEEEGEGEGVGVGRSWVRVVEKIGAEVRATTTSLSASL